MSASAGPSHAGAETSTAPVDAEIPPADRQAKPRKNISYACRACQKRKLKCEGVAPCRHCANKNIECVFEHERDGRSHKLGKRKWQEFERHSRLLQHLMEAIRYSQDAEVLQLVALIRSNASLDEVELCVELQIKQARLTGREPSPELQEVQDNIHRLRQDSDAGEADVIDHFSLQGRLRRGELKISQLVDSPPYRVPASPWTSVIKDDTLVSNLVSVWLTWEKPFYNWVDEDLFLRDMRGKHLNSTYCSAFLVNAILATACVYSDYPEARARRGTISSLMLKFTEEAKKLISEDVGGPSITKAQGLSSLFLAASLAGDDGIGYDYLKRAVAICKELETNKDPTPSGSDQSTQEDLHEYSRALSTTCWGVFNLATMTQTVLKLPPMMLSPQRPMPLPIRNNHDWTPYPQTGQPISSYSKEILHHRSVLSLIARDILLHLYGSTESDKRRQNFEDVTLLLYERLALFRSSLPAHLLTQANSPPSVLTFQSYYSSIVLAMFGPSKAQTEGVPAAEANRVQQLKRAAALEIVQICRLHQSLYGNAHMTVFLVQPLYLALVALMSEEDVSTYSSEILDLCIYFRATSRRFPIAMAVMRMFQVSAQQSGKALPVETEKLFEEFEQEDWRQRTSYRVTSQYPVLGGKDQDSSEVQNLSDFFAMMERLEVADTKPTASS